MAKPPKKKTKVDKVADTVAVNRQFAEDMARGAAAEPEKMAEAAQLMLKNASPFYWLSLQQRFAQEHFNLMTRAR